ncbi:hypothetical protein G6F43_011103 [Rhizopus delemar]|nr:hypothetical protein G6F43_011103 [Rhizopus delemar]
MGNTQSQTSKTIKQDDTEESEGLDFHKAKNKSPPNPSLPPSPIYTSNDAHNTKTVIVNGRRYQNFNTKYILPNDDEEQDRLVQAHFIYKHLFNGNFSAPVRGLLSGPVSSARRGSSGSSQSNWEDLPPPRVLDLGCGNGTWILEMATEFKHAHFYGIDISPNYPTAIKPPNTFFIQYDILNPKGLPFPDSYFDYVFMRQVYTCFSSSDWTTVVREIKRVVKPGGFVEFRDIDPILKNIGPTTYKLFEKFPETMKNNYDVDVDWAKNMYSCLQKVGQMTDMHQIVRMLRSGNSGPICHTMNNSLKSGLNSYRYFFQKNYNLSSEEYDKITEKIVNEAIDYRSYFSYFNCWGRKPLYDCHLAQSIKTQSDRLEQNRPQSNSSHRASFNLPPSPTSLGDIQSSDENHIFGQDSVSDINQFIQGYED